MLMKLTPETFGTSRKVCVIKALNIQDQFKTILKSIFGTFWDVVIPAAADRVGVEFLRFLVDQVEVGHDHAARAIICVDL